jgi:hypothetical protein
MAHEVVCCLCAAAGRSVGVAKEARVVAVRVLDCEGAGSISNVVAGMCIDTALCWQLLHVLWAPCYELTISLSAVGMPCWPHQRA